MDFKDRVKSRRYALNMTQTQFAKTLGCGRWIIEQWEKGLSMRPREGSTTAKALDRFNGVRPSRAMPAGQRRSPCRSETLEGAPRWSRQIRAYRVEHGLSQKMLASILGVSPETISTWERGLSLPTQNRPYFAQLISMGVDLVDATHAHERQRPKKRSQCPPIVDGSRSCPWVMCRHHMVIDVSRSGRIIGDENPHRSFDCSLDAAEHHSSGMTLEAVGSELGVCRERVRQIELEAFKSLLNTAPDLIEWLTRSEGDGQAKRGASSLGSLS